MYFAPRKTPPSPYINRFLQPDSIIPDLSNPQSWNRYSYVTNRPVNFSDPSGHRPCGDEEVVDCTGRLNNPTTSSGNCSGSGCQGNGGGGFDPNFDLQLPSDFTFTCAGCLQTKSMPDDFYWSFLPFSKTEVCYAILHNHTFCDSHAWTISPQEILMASNNNGDLVDFLNDEAIWTQNIAMNISMTGAGFEASAITVGCFIGGVAGCLAGWGGSVAIYGTTLNIFETAFSSASTVFTLTADYTDDHNFDDASTTAVTAWAIGLSPDAIIDAGADIYASGYNYGTFCGVTSIFNGSCFP